ncbi:MAG: 6-carboxytetrahydropterin synthase [Syntrophales bacterium]|jgi:6-pyruvoyltetrahydropterin/6-carboxytetrahydropterin synthase|nr:6-carboxytetrahydropterin synthase [Syntrophales bacterium]MCK9528061.1 6-carboxytetrahydropterin synthase [Syntrophales bacterium]MDX9922343.1 6-carboxytetrahydropterin synthase [Syntrophales bacterium]
MYTITIRKTFSAAHTITLGSIGEPMHGHNFAVEISLESGELDQEGVVADFRDIKRHADAVLKDLDHTYLNDVPAFNNVPPTAENIARHIFDSLERAFSPGRTRISRVTVWESESARASYGRDGSG